MLEEKHLFLNRKKLNFFHFRNLTAPCCAATVCLKFLPKDPHIVEEYVTIGIAFCSIKDGFNKRIGRDISSGRINACILGRESNCLHANSMPVEKAKEVIKTIFEKKEISPQEIASLFGTTWVK